MSNWKPCDLEEVTCFLTGSVLLSGHSSRSRSAVSLDLPRGLHPAVIHGLEWEGQSNIYKGHVGKYFKTIELQNMCLTFIVLGRGKIFLMVFLPGV